MLQNIRQRKRGALEKAIDRYTPYIYAIVYRSAQGLLQKEDVEEVVSDVFVSLWKHAGSLDTEKGSLRAYIGTAARNATYNKMRSLKLHDTLDEQADTAQSGPQQTMEQKEDSRMLLDLLIRLGEPDSEIFLRYYYYQEHIPSIAQNTGLCISTVKTKLARGRTKLRKMLEGLEGSERSE